MNDRLAKWIVGVAIVGGLYGIVQIGLSLTEPGYVTPAPMPETHAPAPSPEPVRPRLEMFAAPKMMPPREVVSGIEAASCRVYVEDGKRCTKDGCFFEYSAGSGTLIAPGRVVTCAHLFRDMREGGECRVEFGGKSHPAELLKIDPTPDLALLAVEGVSIEPTEWVDVIDSSQPIDLCGFGAGNFQKTTGRFVRWWGYQDGRQHSFSVDVDGRSGDSGGGAFNRAGQLIGVRFGAKDGHTFVVGGEPLVKFLWPQN
jgi:S1-C subfamily serine protease